MTEPARRRIEQPTEDQAKRSGCLLWGGVLGVLVGIMVGIYALPPILKHYYGETVVAPQEFYRGEGKAIRLVSVTSIPVSGGEVRAGMQREDFEVAVIGVVQEEWRPAITDWTLEFEELEEWQKATGLLDDTPDGFVFRAGSENEYRIHFTVWYPEGEAESLTPEALHLSDPRVKFEIAPP